MTKNLRTISGLALLVLLIGAAYYAYHTLSKGYDSTALQTPSLSEGRVPAPSGGQPSDEKTDAKTAARDFTVTAADGNAVALSHFFGRPIVLNFWASWCPPCRAELPDFEKVYTENKGEVQFLMVNLADGQRETVAKASKFVSDGGYTFPVYYDTRQNAAYVYSVNSIPTTFFIDKDGYIIAGQEGQLSEANLRKGISLIKP